MHLFRDEGESIVLRVFQTCRKGWGFAGSFEERVMRHPLLFCGHHTMSSGEVELGIYMFTKESGAGILSGPVLCSPESLD